MTRDGDEDAVRCPECGDVIGLERSDRGDADVAGVSHEENGEHRVTIEATHRGPGRVDFTVTGGERAL